MAKQPLTIGTVRRYLRIDAVTGDVLWARTRHPRARAGRIAGKLKGTHRIIRFFGHEHSASTFRLALEQGQWPPVRVPKTSAAHRWRAALWRARHLPVIKLEREASIRSAKYGMDAQDRLMARARAIVERAEQGDIKAMMAVFGIRKVGKMYLRDGDLDEMSTLPDDQIGETITDLSASLVEREKQLLREQRERK